MLFVRITVWLALLGYIAGVVAAFTKRNDQALQRVARLFWTAGCAFFILHVGAAFHFSYQWSHTLALQETAQATAVRTGIESGFGLYLNYLFTLLWILDTLCWWKLGLKGYLQRPRWIDITLHSFFFFMAFNATVIFAAGAIRWFAIATSLAFGGLLVLRRRLSE